MYTTPLVSELPDPARLSGIISIDTETRDPQLLDKGCGGVRKDGNIVGYSVACGDFCRYVPIAHKGGGNVTDVEGARRWMRDVCALPNPKLGANIIYDLEWLRAEGIEVRGKKYDVQHAESLINENKQTYNLESLCVQYLGEHKDEVLLKQAAVRLGAKEDEAKSVLWRMHAHDVGEYGEQDARVLERIWNIQMKEIEKQELQTVLDMETELVDLLLDMRFKGIRVDIEKCTKIRDMLLTEENELRACLKMSVGWDVDIWSPDDVARCCEKLGIEVPLTAKGNKSTTSKWLEESTNPALNMIQGIRKINRCGGVYLQSKVLDMAVGDRVYPSFYQLKNSRGGTESGRFSSANPNIQQIPARDPRLGPLVRSIFIPEDCGRWVQCDYCFSDDTEVLTENGWRLFRAIEDNRIANVDPFTSELTYDKPISKQVLWYDGFLNHIVGKRHMDMLVTPNHRCLLYSADTRMHGFFSAEEYCIGGYKQMHSGVRSGELDLPEHSISLLCAIQADAQNRGKGVFRFFLKKDRKIDRLKNSLKLSGTEFEVCAYKSKPGYSVITVRASDHPWLSDFLNFKDKTFNRDNLLSLKSASRIFFLKELGFWDGHIQKEGHNWNYCSTNLRNAEIVSELSAVSGIRANIAYRNPPNRKRIGVVSLTNKNFTYTDTFTNNKIPYKGFVYCVTMPKSTVIVRRNGKVCVTGQSQQEPRLTVHYANILQLAGAERMKDKYINDPTADYHQMVADIAGIDRKPAKTIGLGCIAVDTLVLTDSGWKTIQSITSIDKVWDGNYFVSCKGAFFSGNKSVIKTNGVWTTHDHKILLRHGWKEAEQIGSVCKEEFERLQRPRACWSDVWKMAGYVARRIYNKLSVQVCPCLRWFRDGVEKL
jgi:hypothetical protein